MVQLYKMGRAGYWRLLLDVNSLRELGRAYRTAAALGPHRPRSRRGAPPDAGGAGGGTGHAAGAGEGADRARAEGPVGARRRRSRGHRAHRTGRSRSTNARDLNAQLDRRTAGRAATAAGDADARPRRRPERRPRRALPLRPFQGTLPWPAEGVLSSRFGRQPPRTPRAAGRATASSCHFRKVSRSRPSTRGRWRLPTSSRGYANLVIVEHGGQVLFPLRPSVRPVGQKGRPGGRRDDRWAGWPEPVRQPVPVLRAARRR